MEEIWVDLPGFAPGTYQVSNLGNFRNMKFGYERKLNPCTSHGYVVISLTKDGVQKVYKAHRLVWSAFNGPIPEGMQINHLNEVKTDNRLENLSLCTSLENNNWGTRNARISSTKSLPVKCTREFASLTEAARWLGKKGGESSIHHALNSSGSAYGYTWEYIKK